MKTQDQTIMTGNGREIRIRQAGDADGVPVLVHHGTPGSRLLNQAWVDDSVSKGIRLIGYDRPGYGGSSPYPGRNVAEAAEDLAVIADALDLDRLAVWGHSGGGPHALACAALRPDLVFAAAILASPAPYQADGIDWFEGVGESNLEEFGAALKSREALAEFIERETPGLLSADPDLLREALQSLLSPVDAAVLTGDFVIELIDDFREGILRRRDGWIEDDLAFIDPWGFDLNMIQIPILLMHGVQDRFASVSHGKWLGEQIPGVDSRIFPDDGHLTLVANRIPEVHSWFLGQME